MIDIPGIVFAINIWNLNGSTPSLIAGLVFGVLIAIGAFLFSQYLHLFYFGLIISLALALLMGWRFFFNGLKYMPAGFIFTISLGMVLWYSGMGYMIMNN